MFDCKKRLKGSIFAIVQILFFFDKTDLLAGYHHGHGCSKADVGRHRGEARGHHQVGDVHQGAARHVHGHGNAGRESGKEQLFLYKKLMYAYLCPDFYHANINCQFVILSWP